MSTTVNCLLSVFLAETAPGWDRHTNHHQEDFEGHRSRSGIGRTESSRFNTHAPRIRVRPAGMAQSPPHLTKISRSRARAGCMAGALLCPGGGFGQPVVTAPLHSIEPAVPAAADVVPSRGWRRPWRAAHSGSPGELVSTPLTMRLTWCEDAASREEAFAAELPPREDFFDDEGPRVV